jgi:hypothetical protein
VCDSHWVYAGCDNGTVYDLSHEVVRVAYRIGVDQKQDAAASSSAADMKDVKEPISAASASSSSSSASAASAAAAAPVDTIPPKHLVFVIDCSGSMSGAYIQACMDNMEQIVDTMVRPEDRVSLLRFNNFTQVVRFFA